MMCQLRTRADTSVVCHEAITVARWPKCSCRQMDDSNLNSIGFDWTIQLHGATRRHFPPPFSAAFSVVGLVQVAEYSFLIDLFSSNFFREGCIIFSRGSREKRMYLQLIYSWNRVNWLDGLLISRKPILGNVAHHFFNKVLFSVSSSHESVAFKFALIKLSQYRV